ncbi:helix-turn-helix transcriptional regulator [Pengzhenrongella sp.]|uniref:helix-turn-helix domain-containing protein n=1 Tax=Pengzhenrongella sp. TaxID=2888820 RepID=UPI002F92F836
MKRTRTHSAPTMDAVGALGAQIAAARRERRWTVADLAERAGIAPATLRGVERGAPTVAIGVVFELATLLGVPLFGVAARDLAGVRAVTADRLSLLPHRVRGRADRDDDF